jgi:hypothetical protein
MYVGLMMVRGDDWAWQRELSVTIKSDERSPTTPRPTNEADDDDIAFIIGLLCYDDDGERADCDGVAVIMFSESNSHAPCVGARGEKSDGSKILRPACSVSPILSINLTTLN